MENIQGHVHLEASLPSNQEVKLPSAKLEKLVTAIYMVTDFMDKDEPIKGKLRSLSLELLTRSETSSVARSLASCVGQLMSFIKICSAMSFISPMNASILNNELKSIKDKASEGEVKLQEFFRSFNFDKGQETLSHAGLIRGTNPRRDSILKLIKDKREVTIKDIAIIIKDCGEKTIQRELMSLMGQGLVRKTGEKRWSRYSLKA